MENIYKVCLQGIFKHPIMCGQWEAMFSVKSLNLVKSYLKQSCVLSSSLCSIQTENQIPHMCYWLTIHCIWPWNFKCLENTRYVSGIPECQHTPLLFFMHLHKFHWWYKTIKVYALDTLTDNPLYQFPHDTTDLLS